MMPVVVAGGVILAVSLLGATQTETGLVPNGPLLTYLNQLGKAGMAMMIPVFAAYISYSVAGIHFRLYCKQCYHDQWC